MATLSRLLKKIACINSTPMEIILAVQALFFGVFLLLPGDAFGTTQVYHILSLIMPEGIWGLIFIAVAILEMVSISNSTDKLRGTAITLALFLWLTVDLSSWFSNANSAATVSYLTFVLMAMWSVIAVSTKDYFDCDHR